MTTPYQRLVAVLETLKCPNCKGFGECDDAEPGDMSYRKWECTACKRTGFRDGERYTLDLAGRGQ